MDDKENSLTHALGSLTHALTSFVLVVGNLSEGFRFIGPFSSFDEACEYPEYSNKITWISTLEKPLKPEDYYGDD